MVLERSLEEKGLFYIVGIAGLIFSMLLVINYDVEPVVFYGYSLFFIGALMWRFMEKSHYFESYRLSSPEPLVDVGIGVGAAVLWYFVMIGTKFGVLPLPPLPAKILAAGTAPLLIVSILAPLAEEYFFRGSLIPQLEEIFGTNLDFIVAITISSLAFMLFHWGVYLSGSLSSALIASALFGMYVGGIAYWRKSILAPIITHMIVNGVIAAGKYAVIA